MTSIIRGKQKHTTVARFGDWRVRRVGGGPLHDVVGKGEKFGNIFGSRDDAVAEAKVRRLLKGRSK